MSFLSPLDGYGDDTASITACAEPSGYTDDDSDCDDGEAAVNPDATELCDGVDNDCDGLVDDDDSSGASDIPTWYADDDLDGYGDALETIEACAQPSGYVADDSDCDDLDSDINPGAAEPCNAVDDDCSGTVDDGGTCPCMTAAARWTTEAPAPA